MLKNVGVVIVTYGNRAELLKKVVEKVLLFEEVVRIVIVDNNSCGDLNINHKDIIIIRNSFNTGSAYGYKQGISTLMKQENVEYIWLLDDDNLPNFNSFKDMNIFVNSKINFQLNKDAILCLRDDRKAYKKAIKMPNKVKYMFPTKNSFLGFNIFYIVQKLYWNIFINYIGKKLVDAEYVEVPVAPYGGLIFHKSLVENIGYPNEEMYLYSDDNEYTYRITSNNGRIILCSKFVIKDIDESWFIRTKKGYLSSLLTSDQESRVYYTVRNRVYTEKKYLLHNKYIYSLNKMIYLLILKILALKYKKQTRYKYILKAISDGDKGILGQL
ncbi:glycosyltransferase [Geobacillus stearothermophilus]|nr:glycosyltransferase [Geobacillus stearothermophilus]WJQ10484.1 glycosyltransferase [Geobacillus stearothermophilus]